MYTSRYIDYYHLVIYVRRIVLLYSLYKFQIADLSFLSIEKLFTKCYIDIIKRCLIMVLREKVYMAVKERIVNGYYRPGEPLNEKAIIDELHVSRTPFREAINALSKENLIQIYANRGIFVRDITAKDITDIFDIRFQLEPYVSQLSCRYMPKLVIVTLRSRAKEAIQKDYSAMLAEDDYYHKKLLDYTDNNHLKKIMLNLYEQNSMQAVLYDDSKECYISDERREAAVLSLAEHIEILACIEKKDEMAAMEATRKHLMLARSRAAN